MTRRWLSAGAALAFFPPLVSAQETVLKPFRSEDDKPVMRAVPVERPRAVPAEPVETAPATPMPVVPRSTPTVRRAKPVRGAEPAATPTRAVPAMPEPTDPSEIRMTPTTGARSPEQAQLQVADNYYARRMYETAAPEYQRYLDLYPTADEIPAAMFRMAESYRRMGSVNSAKTAYDSLLSRFQVGEFVGPAAYRLADLYYQERNYAAALPAYRKAALRLKELPVINAARFYTARCLEAGGGAGNKLEATDVYKELADADRATNPFADASRLSLALLLREQDRTTEALRNIQLLAKQTDNPELKVEATVRAGLWELDLHQAAKAGEDLKKALEMPNLGKWKEVARVGMLRMYYDTEKYKQVIESYAELGGAVSPEMLPEVLMLAGNSERQLGHLPEALGYYDRLVKEFPGSVYAKESAYQRLVCLYNADSPNLLPEIDGYLANLPETQKRDQVLLMKGEVLFRKEDYAGAAAVYAPVVLSTQLPGTLKAEALFKHGWCCMQLRDFERARKSFTQYIDENPTSKQMCSARVQRAVALQSLKNLAAAEKDYVEVIKKFPKCKERELALQQEALIRGQMNDNPGMSENFELLLRDYPKSPAAAQAHYWIGSTAYEVKEYKKAAEHLALARELDKEQFFERAGQRLILAHYFQEDRDGVAREVDIYRAGSTQPVQAEVLRWLGEQYFDKSAWESAERFFSVLAAREDVAPRDLLRLGESRLQLQKYADAAKTLGTYLETVKEPVTRALGLEELCRAQIGMKDFGAAQKSVDEALTLQPEGKLSGEARILAGDIEAAQGNWEAAAKLFASVAVIVDDEDVTPRALEKAAQAYAKAGKEAEAKKTLNNLQSRYPEYVQHRKAK